MNEPQSNPNPQAKPGITLLDASGNPLPAATRQKAQMMASANVFRRAHEAAGYGTATTANWHAPTISGAAASRMDRETISDRVRELERNDGSVATAIDKKLNSVVGAHWMLAPRPNAESLGLSPSQAKSVTRQIKSEWKNYAYESGFWCDLERDGDVDDTLQLAARHLFLDGEAFCVFAFRDSPTGYSTCAQIIHPRRCSNPNNKMDSEVLQDGCQLDENGATVGYWFRRAHPGDITYGRKNAWTWDYFPRETEAGRPRTVHVRMKKEAGMKRAVSEFASVLRTTKQGHMLTDYELQASMLNAVMGAFIRTPGDMFDASDSLAAGAEGGAQSTYAINREMHAENPIKIDGVQVHTLGMGEDITLTNPNHPNANFEPFLNTVLRGLAARMGITYEQMTGDWSNVNYSSARAAILEVTKGFVVAAGLLKKQFMAAWYRCFLEEAFDLGRIIIPKVEPGEVSNVVPLFDEMPQAWCHADWIGAGKGYVDPLKEVQAAALRVATGLTSKGYEIAEQGKDPEDVARQIAEDRELDIAHGNNPHACAEHGTATRGKPTQAVEEEVEEETSGPKANAKTRASIVPRFKRVA